MVFVPIRGSLVLDLQVDLTGSINELTGLSNGRVKGTQKVKRDKTYL